MKQKIDIEKELQNWKKRYKVPDNYFNEIKIPEIQERKIMRLPGSVKTWLIAAAVLLLISFSYKLLNWQQQDKFYQSNDKSPVTQADDLFDDLTEDEIIDYLIDEDVTLEYLDEIEL